MVLQSSTPWQQHQSTFYSPASTATAGSFSSRLRPSISCQHAINAGKSHQSRQQHCSFMGHTIEIGSKRNVDIKPNKISWLGKGSVWFIKTFMDSISCLAFLQAVTRKRNMSGGIPNTRFCTFIASSVQTVHNCSQQCSSLLVLIFIFSQISTLISSYIIFCARTKKRAGTSSQ